MFVRGPEALKCSAFSLSLPSIFFLQCIKCCSYDIENCTMFEEHNSACTQFCCMLFNKN